MNEKSKQDFVEDWNLLLHYLAAAETLPGEQVDLLILAGNSLPYLTEEAGKLYKEGIARKILLTGGVGHATKYLRKNYEKLGFQFPEGTSEAEMNQHFLIKVMGLPEDDLIIENKSTQSGENAQFSLAKFSEQELPRQVVILEDPILQRRIQATFRKVWQCTSSSFMNFVPIIPELISFDNEPEFSNSRQNGLWSRRYFIDLVLGEIPRLTNDSDGYGPKGRNFIAAVEVPEEVQAAFQRLNQSYQYHTQR